MKIKIKEKSKYGGRIIAHRGNQEVGYLIYHIDLYEDKKITVSQLDARYPYDRNEVEDVLLSYMYETYANEGYKIRCEY